MHALNKILSTKYFFIVYKYFTSIVIFSLCNLWLKKLVAQTKYNSRINLIWLYNLITFKYKSLNGKLKGLNAGDFIW